MDIDMKSGKKFFATVMFVCVMFILLTPPRAESVGSALFPRIGTYSESVKEVFEKLSTDGTKLVMNIDADDWPDVEEYDNHIQGYAIYKDLFHIFSHSDNEDYGRLIFVSTTGTVKNEKEYTPDKIYTMNTPSDGYNHPGSIQLIGDYLLVGTENDDGKGKIWLYDLTTINTSGSQFLKDPKLLRDNLSKASTVGVTDITRLDGKAVPSGKSVYAIGVMSNQELVIYTSNEVNQGNIMDIGPLTYRNRYVFKTDGDYHSIAFFCAADRSLCMVGFRAISTGSWDDHCDVYQLTYTDGSFRESSRRLFTEQMKTDHGAMVGSFGVHFRWGAGLQIIGDGEFSSNIRLIATQRNNTYGEVAINIFAPKNDSMPDPTPEPQPTPSPNKGGSGGCNAGVMGALAAVVWAICRGRRPCM